MRLGCSRKDATRQLTRPYEKEHNDLIENLAEFEKQLAQGRGGVALFLQKNLPLLDDYRDALLHACLNDLCYEPFTEEGRAAYLHELISMSGQSDFYREQILAFLSATEPSEKNKYDLMQLMGITRRLAQGRDEEARTALYATFQKNAAQDHLIGGDDLVFLDGVDGLLFLVDHYSDEEDGFEISSFYWKLSLIEEQKGEEITRKELAAKCEGNSLREAWLRRLDAYREGRKPSRKNKSKYVRPTYEALKQKIAEKGQRCHVGRLWGTHFTKKGLRQIATDLLSENDLERQVPLLRVFDEVPFPLDPTRIFEWAKESGEVTLPATSIATALSWASLQALGSLKSPAVRAFALEIIEQQRGASPAVKMLNTNYEPGDEEKILFALERFRDLDYYHSLCLETKVFEEAHPSSLSARIMEVMYENDPCSLCRERHVERLIELNALPEWIREEAEFDAVEDTRKIVREVEQQSKMLAI